MLNINFRRRSFTLFAPSTRLTNAIVFAVLASPPILGGFVVTLNVGQIGWQWSALDGYRSYDFREGVQ